MTPRSSASSMTSPPNRWARALFCFVVLACTGLFAVCIFSWSSSLLPSAVLVVDGYLDAFGDVLCAMAQEASAVSKEEAEWEKTLQEGKRLAAAERAAKRAKARHAKL